MKKNIHIIHAHHLIPSLSKQKLNTVLLKESNSPVEFHSLIKELDTPQKIQVFMKEKLKYHHKDTVRAFPDIIRYRQADCFEGGIGFAYPILLFWGYRPYVVMLHADHKRDVDHTLIIYRTHDKIGAIAKSSFSMLMDREPIYDTLHDLINTYYPHYLSDFEGYVGENTLIGYSDPIDLLPKFGINWFFLKGDNALQNLYDHFTDNVMCTNYHTHERFLYPPED